MNQSNTAVAPKHETAATSDPAGATIKSNIYYTYTMSDGIFSTYDVLFARSHSHNRQTFTSR